MPGHTPAWLYDNGLGVLQDYAKAAHWYRLAAKQGYARAQYNLGWLTADIGALSLIGRGISQNDARRIKKNFARGFHWLRLAARQGYAEAQFFLGLIYATGAGVPQDYSKALHWYRLAAKQGFAKAQRNIGVFYYNGWGVPQNFAKAAYWINLADNNKNQ